jgi:NADPH-dependent 2,4-dienoyl-CoA reductase/sulfur reductase-like enzyme
MAAAVALKRAGLRGVLLVDRERGPGGILPQCIHNGFGLHEFEEELTGPEYAQRYIDMLAETEVEVLARASAVDLMHDGDGQRVILLSEELGMVDVRSRAVVLAMGCRERNRGNLAIPGTRPAGIMTAGLAQRLVNLYGHLPGREVVILGSGDIGLIMARRLTWEGAHVQAVVEINSYPGGLHRNITQCLDDFSIPLHLSHAVTRIVGDKRMEAVEVSPLDQQFEPRPGAAFVLPCDCLLLSVGLVPENELSLRAGVELDPITRGPLVDRNLMTSVPGVFACGNVLHVHDLVDYVSREATACGLSAAAYLSGALETPPEIAVRPGNLVRYVLPRRVGLGCPAELSLRPMAPAENVALVVRTDGRDLVRLRQRRIYPSTMLRVQLERVPDGAEDLQVFFESAE